MGKYWWAPIVIMVVIIVYNAIGGAIFQALEQPYETEVRITTMSSGKNFLTNYTCVDPEALIQLLKAYENAINNGISFSITANGTTDVAYEPSPSNWDYWNSFFFSMTAMTTIGYGNITPSTTGGKVMVCIYALIGIPLFGIIMAMIGEKLNSPCSKLQAKLESASCLEDRPKTVAALFFVIVITVGFLIFFALPALVFVFTEGWTYGISIYYAFITLTTIGFGDYVAGQSTKDDGVRTLYKIILYIWIFVGLSYMAMIIEQISVMYKSGMTRMEKNKNAESSPVDAISLKERNGNKYSDGSGNDAFVDA